MCQLLWVVRKEMLDHLLSFRAMILCLACWGAIALFSYLQALDYAETVRAYSSQADRHRREARDAYAARGSAGRVTVDRAPNPLMIFVQGINVSKIESSELVDGHPRYRMILTGDPLHALFPPADLGFFIGAVMSLLALVLTHGAISGEREDSTLELLMSCSIPRHTVLVAKWLGGTAIVLIPLVLGLLTSIVAVQTVQEAQLSSCDMVAIAGYLVVSAVYVSTMCCLGLLVSACTRRAATSVTASLLLWTAMVLLYPNAALWVAQEKVPSSSLENVDRLKQAVLGERDRRIRQLQEDETTCGTPLDSPGVRDCSLTEEGERLAAQYREAAARDVAHLEDAQDRALAGQRALLQQMARFSPPALYAVAMQKLSGTGSDEADRYAQAISEYGRWLMRDQEAEPSTSARAMAGIPEFTYGLEAVRDRAISALGDLLLLILWHAVLLAIAHNAFCRCEIR